MEDLTPDEARKVLNVSRNTMYRLLRSGRLKSYQLPTESGVGGIYRIRQVDLDKFRETK